MTANRDFESASGNEKRGDRRSVFRWVVESVCLGVLLVIAFCLAVVFLMEVFFLAAGPVGAD